jgi:hypothetical protein
MCIFNRLQNHAVYSRAVYLNEFSARKEHSIALLINFRFIELKDVKFIHISGAPSWSIGHS